MLSILRHHYYCSEADTSSITTKEIKGDTHVCTSINGFLMEEREDSIMSVSKGVQEQYFMLSMYISGLCTENRGACLSKRDGQAFFQT